MQAANRHPTLTACSVQAAIGQWGQSPLWVDLSSVELNTSELPPFKLADRHTMPLDSKMLVLINQAGAGPFAGFDKHGDHCYLETTLKQHPLIGSASRHASFEHL